MQQIKIASVLIFMCTMCMNCHKTVKEQLPVNFPVLPDSPVLGTWSFRDETNSYKGNIIKANFRDSLGRGLLSLWGHMHGGHMDSTFNLAIYFPRQTLDTGGYLTSDQDYGNYFLFMTYPGFNEIYYSGEASSPPSINIRINAYDSVTHKLSGGFEGIVNGYTNPLTIVRDVRVTDGVFEASIQQEKD